MPIGATHPMNTSKGYIKRIFWRDYFRTVNRNFYWLMRDEANPISQAEEHRINQIRYAYYWKGAIVTYGSKNLLKYNKDRVDVIEIQHMDKDTLDSLVIQLTEEISKDTNIKFNIRNIIGDTERRERNK